MATAPKSKPTLSRWFPTVEQLRDPVQLERSLRQVLTQHYALQDQFDKLKSSVANSSAGAGAGGAAGGAPPGSGPADSMLLGLRVAPVDVGTLSDGVKLTFVKKDGNFQFK